MTPIETELLQNLLVEASAGSGKTYSLVQRIVAGLASGTYDLRHIAAVTFTRKAAAELSARLHLALESRGDHAWAIRALRQMPEMFVGTVHSFCGRILREFPVEAGLSPAFREIEPAEDKLLLHRSLRAELESTPGRQAVKTMADFGIRLPELLPGLQEICNRGDVTYPYQLTPAPELTEDWRSVDDFARELMPLLPSRQAHSSCKLTALGHSLPERLRLADRSTPRDLLQILNHWESEPRVIKRDWGQTRAAQNSALEPALALVEDFRGTWVAPRLSLWRTHLYGLLMPFLLHVRAAAAEERRQIGVANYNDLLCRCHSLLTSHARVLVKLRRKFRHLFVDEFQDTDPIQAEIFLLLGGGRAELRPGSLFLVGDPKQSIYRFRHADIQTYESVRRTLLGSGGQVVPLTTSYRSNKSLCSWTNQVFGQLLPGTASTHQAAFAALHSTREALPDQAPIATLSLFSRRMDQVVPEEASRIAAWVSSQGRPFSDVLILTSRRADILPYHSALTSLGVPCQIRLEPGPVSSSGRLLLQVLSVLSDPLDTASVVGVLRGPCFGHSDRELFLHCQAFGYLRVGCDAGESSVGRSLRQLSDLRSGIRDLPPGAAGTLVAHELGLSALEDRRDLQNLCEALASYGAAGLTLAQAVVDLSAEDAQIPPGPSAGGRDAVRIMNVHTAKGLESRIVFLAAPTCGLPIQVDHVVNAQGHGALCLRRQRKLLAHPADWAELEGHERQFLEAERVRLLYVAATRASEQLIVSRWMGPVGSSPRPWSALEPFLEGCPELEVREAKPLQVSSPTLNQQEILAARASQAASSARCRLRSWHRVTVSTSNKTGNELVASLPVDRTQGEGRDWGDLIHRLLEQMVKRPEMSAAELLLLARWFAVDRPELAPYLIAAVEQLEKVRQTPFWQDVLQAQQRLAEVPFGHRSGQALIFGVIDLVLERLEGSTIVDYKTDRKKIEDLLTLYAPQISQYARSWTEITSQPVTSRGVFSVRQGEFREAVPD